MKGWNCDIIRSTFILHCGMFSHQDLVQMTDIEIRQAVPVQQCQTMINTGYLITKEGSTHEVKIGEETIFHVSERGILHEYLYLTEVDGYEHTLEILDLSVYVRQSSDYVIYEAE